MIILDCEQGTDEWFQARLGIPTASRFKDIFTSTGKEASASKTYMNELLAEWLIGEKQDTYQSEWMKRGTELEPEARDYYELVNDADIDQVGLVYLDDRKLISCSPDGLQEKGGNEFKCPKASTQIKYLLDNKCPAEYIPQVQGSIWICDREWWDFMSYHPNMPPLMVRVERDDKYIKGLSEALENFVNKMLEKREKLKQQTEEV